MDYIKFFHELSMADLPLVGGKNASLGQMFSQLSKKGIRIPNGFAITTKAYWKFVQENNLTDDIKSILQTCTDAKDIQHAAMAHEKISHLFENAQIPADITKEIGQAYKQLSKEYNQRDCDVAVRSSATAEDLPSASFAGQLESYLHIHGIENLLITYKKALASLFTQRAIIYRLEQGIDNSGSALSIGVQKMVRSDLACSGVMFTLDTETGFKDAIVINASWGLGEMIVQGSVTPDEFITHKPTLEAGFASIIKKRCGEKKVKMVYDQDHTKIVEVKPAEQNKFCLSDAEILELSRMGLIIEAHYSGLKGSWSPMDIEWAKDGLDGLLYIVQARPETIYGRQHHQVEQKNYVLESAGHLSTICSGQSIGQEIVSGHARVIPSFDPNLDLQKGDILITEMTDPDWMPLLRKAGGIITDHGGRTCHAAIVSRELSIPAIVGTENATQVITDGQEITLDCSHGITGYVYQGKVPFKIIQETLGIKKDAIPVNIMINLADPDSAFKYASLPVDGVGLARIEFIMSNFIKIHPMALLMPEKITDIKTEELIRKMCASYENPQEFFIAKLSQGIGMIAAAFYPKPVIVRCSDFKTNEYRNLIGGHYFEPMEENPMLGLRGASRYYDKFFKPAFDLECEALKRVRDVMGLKNIKIMLPFVRTVDEAKKVLNIMQEHNLQRGKDGLEIIMMCEVPSNVILIEQFSNLFDGFSIGSNDLTQLTLGVDRDSAALAQLFDERDEAVKIMMKMAIEGARKAKRTIGICGQAPSDYPEIADFLIACGINSLSLNVDSVLPFFKRYEKK